MKKISSILALMAGAIISMEGPVAAQGIYLDLGGNPPPRYRDYDGPRTGTEIATVIAETEGTIDRTPGDLGRSTGARMAGPCKTVFASRTAATESAELKACVTEARRDALPDQPSGNSRWKSWN